MELEGLKPPRESLPSTGSPTAPIGASSRRSPIGRGTCRYCHREVLWGTLQNGQNRAFEPEPRPGRDVPPDERFAYSRKQRAVVCLGEHPRQPALVHVPHYCQAYAEARAMRGIDSLGDMTDLPFLRPAADPA